MSVQSIIKFTFSGHTTDTSERSVGMKVIFVLLVIFIILIALMLLDMLLGRAAYKKQAYEPVFDPKKSDITLIHCGSELVQQMTADIRQAVSSIHMMFFIMKNDQVSHEMFDLLKEKARRLRISAARLGGQPPSEKAFHSNDEKSRRSRSFSK